MINRVNRVPEWASGEVLVRRSRVGQEDTIPAAFAPADGEGASARRAGRTCRRLGEPHRGTQRMVAPVRRARALFERLRNP